MKVLICDDSRLILDIFDMVLERLGLEAVRVDNGNHAVDRVKEDDEIGLVFMDLNMPEISGSDTCAQIKAIRPKLPVIAISGMTDEELKAVDVDGFDEVFRKPVKKQELASLVERYAS